MRLFCREDHSEPGPEPDHGRDLVEARARLARLRKLPESHFAERSRKGYKLGPYGPVTYSVDNKADAIAKQEAEIAELSILATPSDTTNKEKVET